MLHFVLCDDNRNTLDKISENLNTIFNKHDIDSEIAFATTNPTKLLKYLEVNKADVIILDIDLSHDVSGIDIAKQIRMIDKTAYIIFLTAHFEYSMLAYKVKTFDFLVKPISISKLEETVLRLYEDTFDNKNLFVRLGNNRHLFKADDILYIEKDKARASVHTTNSQVLIYGTIDEIKNCLPGYFIRCNKSFIVNTQKINYIDSKNHILNINNNTINYSDRYIKDERKLYFNEGNFD